MQLKRGLEDDDVEQVASKKAMKAPDRSNVHGAVRHFVTQAGPSSRCNAPSNILEPGVIPAGSTNIHSWSNAQQAEYSSGASHVPQVQIPGHAVINHYLNGPPPPVYAASIPPPYVDLNRLIMGLDIDSLRYALLESIRDSPTARQMVMYVHYCALARPGNLMQVPNLNQPRGPIVGQMSYTPDMTPQNGVTAATQHMDPTRGPGSNPAQRQGATMSSASLITPLETNQQANSTNEQTQMEDAQTISFSNHFEEVEYILNDKYASSRCSEEFNNSFAAASEVGNIVRAISKAATLPGSSFETKQNALDALHDIGDEIIAGADGSTLGREVLNRDYETAIDEEMLKVLKSMDLKEVKAVAESRYDDSTTYVEKVDELWTSASAYCVFRDLGVVKATLECAMRGETYRTSVCED